MVDDVDLIQFGAASADGTAAAAEGEAEAGGTPPGTAPGGEAP